MAEPTEAAKELLAQAAADYAANQESAASGQAQTEHTVNLLAAQRAADRVWGREPQPAGDE